MQCLQTVSNQPSFHDKLQCILGVAQKSRIFLRAELQGRYISGNTAAKFQRKIMTATPPANAVLCLHLNNSTSELCRDTWLSWALT